MPNDDSGATALNVHTIGVLAIGCGVVLLAASLFWPMLPFGRPNWTHDQAEHFEKASAHLHELAHIYSDGPKVKVASGVPEEIKQARGEVAELKVALDAARNQPARIASALRIVGILLSTAGAIAYFATTQR